MLFKKTTKAKTKNKIASAYEHVEKSEPCVLLVELQNDSGTMERGMEVPPKITGKVSYGLSIPLLSIYPK